MNSWEKPFQRGAS